MKNLVVFVFLVWGGMFLVFGAPKSNIVTLADAELEGTELSEASGEAYDTYAGTESEAVTDTDAVTDPDATKPDTSESTETTETTKPDTTKTEDTTEAVPKEKTEVQATLYQFTSDFYRVYSDESEEKAKATAVRMEAALKLYNSIFHFDLTKLNVKLKVKIYSTVDAFNAYIRRFVTEKKNDFVYIHYADLGKCELVGFEKQDMAEFDQALLHQGFVQFMKAFVGNPPLWLQEGMAAYFEGAEYKEDLKSFNPAGELVWLETLKKIIKNQSDIPFMSLDDLLAIDKGTSLSKINTFYPEAWGLVYFMLKSPNKDINRILWDALISLDPALSVTENSQKVKEKAFSWLGTSTVEEEYKNFILSQKTFADLIAEGVDYYSNNEMEKAKQAFSACLERDTTNYIPYYYLGLINYAAKDFLTADTYYNKAMELGAPTALIYYALGVNAFADNNFEAAVTHLKEAEKLDPDNYKEKVEELLQRIESSSTL